MAKIELPNPIIPLSVDFIEKYMPNANPTHVSVFIYALAQCYQNKPSDSASIASALDILESDVIKAWKYWMKVGLISVNEDGEVTFLAAPREIADEPRQPKPEKKAAPPKEKLSRDIPMDEITHAMENDRTLQDTFKMAQLIWGKPLTQSEIKLMYYILDWYSFSNEVLLMLVEYCAADENTKSAKYMEAVAEGWARDGITSVKAAEKVLKKKEKERTMAKKCAQMFSIGRAFSDKELEYISRWTTDFSMNEAMIKEAYARTTVQTGKLSFPYMNKILETWAHCGIRTMSALKDSENAHKQAKQSKTAKTAAVGENSHGSAYDDIERLEFERRMKRAAEAANNKE